VEYRPDKSKARTAELHLSEIVALCLAKTSCTCEMNDLVKSSIQAFQISYPISESEIVIPDFEIPEHWPRGARRDVGWTGQTFCIW
jgi:hypothetical protein